MPELRKDPINQRWVIIKGNEKTFNLKKLVSMPQIKKGGKCPFCPGNESMTPPAIISAKDNEGNWKTRVIPNKFPALKIEGSLGRSGIGIYDKMNGIGAHEVIIESTDHYGDFSTYSLEEATTIMKVFRARYKDLLNDSRFKYILIFKNFGKPAGASMEHCHCQLIATPVIPKIVMEEMEYCLDYYNYRERCPFCDIVTEELEHGERLIYQNKHFIVIAPFAARFAFESWIMPRKHSSDFESITDEEATYLADALTTLLKKQSIVLNVPPFNFIIHTAPCKVNGLPFYHWHIEIMPRLSKISGVEWGTGFYINSAPPEIAAKLLREAKID